MLLFVHVETDIGMLMLTINTNDGQSLSDKHKELLSELTSEAASAQMGKNPQVFKKTIDGKDFFCSFASFLLGALKL